MSRFFEVLKSMEPNGFKVETQKNNFVSYRYIAQIKISRICKRDDYKKLFVAKLGCVVRENKMSQYMLRWLPETYEKDNRAKDTIAFITFKDNNDHMTLIRCMDGNYFGIREEGKYIAVKPNGFSNIQFNYNLHNNDQRNLLDGVKRFNNKYYVETVSNPRTSNENKKQILNVKDEYDSDNYIPLKNYTRSISSDQIAESANKTKKLKQSETAENTEKDECTKNQRYNNSIVVCVVNVCQKTK
jgi:hypothetical protein